MCILMRSVNNNTILILLILVDHYGEVNGLEYLISSELYKEVHEENDKSPGHELMGASPWAQSVCMS